MEIPTRDCCDSVLILKEDRLYAEVLRQSVLRVFGRARVRIVPSVATAAASLAAEPADLLITGIGASMEGDVLDLLGAPRGPSTRVPRVLVVTAGCGYRVLATLRALSISGVFDAATDLPDVLVTALRSVGGGGRYWSQSFLDEMDQAQAASTGLFRFLTLFEQLVLAVVGDGCDDTAAAQELGLSPATVSTVRRDLHRKLGVQHRGELVRVAAQHGFVRFTPTGVVRPGFSLLASAYHARKVRRTEPIHRVPDTCLSH